MNNLPFCELDYPTKKKIFQVSYRIIFLFFMKLEKKMALDKGRFLSVEKNSKVVLWWCVCFYRCL